MGEVEGHRFQRPVRCAFGGQRGRISVIRRMPVPLCMTDMFRTSKEVATWRSLLPTVGCGTAVYGTRVFNCTGLATAFAVQKRVAAV